MRFAKMHGTGNDYIYVDCFQERISDPAVLAARLSDRHFGIGSDGLVLIGASQCADVSMRIFNADGTEAGMCGNAIRCVGKYCYERGILGKNAITVETKSGVRALRLHLCGNQADAVSVNMGEPVLDPALIPCGFDGNRVVERPLLTGGRRWLVTCVSMGNPHAVTFVEDIEALDLPLLGPGFECHELFPERVNTEFVQADSGALSLRVWERGAGETLACGTGACAALVASVLTGRSGREADIRLPGGTLGIKWDETDNCVYMTGEAEFVFDGEIDAALS